MSAQSNKLRELATAIDALDAMIGWREICKFSDMVADNSVSVSWETGRALQGYADIKRGVCDILRSRMINDLIDEAIHNQRRVVQNLRVEVFELGR